MPRRSAQTLWLEKVEQSVGHESGERGLEAALAASRATELWPDGSLRQRVNRKCVLNPPPTVTKIKQVGLDVHAETITSASADSSGGAHPQGIVPAHTHSVDRLVKKLAEDGAQVRYVYEAGPTGLWLGRPLRGKGVLCYVIAPSLIPQKASDRVKTDGRDTVNLARLFRSGELTVVRVPDEADEAIRDLVRTRLASVEDRRRCRQWVKGYLLRYGRRYHQNPALRHPGKQPAREAGSPRPGGLGSFPVATGERPGETQAETTSRTRHLSPVRHHP